MKVSTVKSKFMLLLLCCAVVVSGALMSGCAGSDGAAGAKGANGDNIQVLVDQAVEPAGANCANGGTAINAGLDTNGSGVLDVAEITSTQYVCNGAAGGTGGSGPAGTAALVALTAEVAGANCVNGGTKVTVGPDTNGNTVLDAGEVTSTNYVCNGINVAAKVESCKVCHASGSMMAINTVHTGLVAPTQVVISNISVPVADGLLNSTGTFTINFTVKDASGNVISSLTNTNSSDSGKRLAYLRFNYAYLSAGAGAGDPTKWINVNYGINDRNIDKLANLGGGDYSYTVSVPTGTQGTSDGIVNGHIPTWVVWNPAAQWRLGISVAAITNVSARATNATFDFVPDGVSTPALNRRDIVTTAACWSCHGYNNLHGRTDVKMCTMCHTDSTVRKGVMYSLTNLAHQIHSGITTSAMAAAEFPQSVSNCNTCHKGLDGDNWKTAPSVMACGGCHISIVGSFPDPTDITAITTYPTVTQTTANTGGGHHGGVKTNSQCAGCHDATNITSMHSPDTIAGMANFTYAISGVTVDGSGYPTITFSISNNGTPVTLQTSAAACTDPGSVVTSAPTITGASNVRFYMAYTSPQDGITTPNDFNMNGKLTEPSYVNLYDICRGAVGSIADAGGGSYNAIISSGTGSFPAGSTMRTVGMKGSLLQTDWVTLYNATGVSTPASYLTYTGGANGYARITAPAVKTVTGNTARRTVVTMAKCQACHDKEFTNARGTGGLHSGDRSDPNFCVICHNTNRNGKSSNLYPLDRESWTANLSNVVHSIHAAAVRVNDFNWHQDQNYQDVGYPGTLSNCTVCHEAGTFDYSAANYTDAMMKNFVPATTTYGDMYTAATGTVNYGTTIGAAANLVDSPITEKCIACHDGYAQKAHAGQQGGSVNEPRMTLP